MTRFRLHVGLFGVASWLLVLAGNVGELATLTFTVGLTLGPALITTFSLAEGLVPASTLTEGLAWLIAGMSLGYGAGSSGVGAVIDAHGPRAGFVLAGFAGLTITTLGMWFGRRVRVGVNPPMSSDFLAAE